jgi:hypothetical protein
VESRRAIATRRVVSDAAQRDDGSLAGDEVIASVLAYECRPDLDSTGIGHGRADTFITSQVRLQPERLKTLRIQRASDHAELLMSLECRASVWGVAEEVTPVRIGAIA